jgi:hypothetical protein
MILKENTSKKCLQKRPAMQHGTACRYYTSNFCVQLVKKPTKTKQMMEGSEKYRTMSKSWVYKWHARFSGGMCDMKDAERSGRPPLSKDSTKSQIHDIAITVFG